MCDCNPFKQCTQNTNDGQVTLLPWSDKLKTHKNVGASNSANFTQSQFSGVGSTGTIATANDFMFALGTSSVAYFVTNNINLGLTMGSLIASSNIAIIGVKDTTPVLPLDCNVIYVGYQPITSTIIFIKGNPNYDGGYQYYIAKKRIISFSLVPNVLNGLFLSITSIVLGFLRFETCNDVLMGTDPGTISFNTIQNDVVSPSISNSGFQTDITYPNPVGILIGTATTSLLESVDLYVNKVLVFSNTLHPIGGFMGFSDSNTVNRCNVVGNGPNKSSNIFSILSTSGQSHMGIFIGSTSIVTLPNPVIYNCAVTVTGYKTVYIGSINIIAVQANIGGFIGDSEAMIQYCSLNVLWNGNVVIGVPFGNGVNVTISAGPPFAMLGGPNIPVSIGGFIGYSDFSVGSCKAIFSGNGDVVIGEDIYYAANLTSNNVGTSSSSVRASIGGFVGLVDENLVYQNNNIKNELLMSNNKKVIVGSRIQLGGTLFACGVGESMFHLAIGGWFGAVTGSNSIDKCVAKFENNKKVVIGFDISVFSMNNCSVGDLGLAESARDGIGGFGGFALWSGNNFSMSKCNVVFEKNDIVGIGIGICVTGSAMNTNIGCLDVNLGADVQRGFSGVGGFFGLINAVTVNVSVVSCSGIYEENNSVCVGVGVCYNGDLSSVVIAGVGSTNSDVAENGAGIGGYGGIGVSSGSLVFSECVASYRGNSLAIGASIRRRIGVGGIGGIGGVVYDSGIGGYWGEVQGTVGAFVLDNSDGCNFANLCQVLIYKSSPGSLVHMSRYIGYPVV